MKHEYLYGQKYGMLTVLDDAGKRGTLYMLKCKCECGNETVVYMCNLRTGHTTSCGCYSRKVNQGFVVKHGMTDTKLYGTWCNMKNRCYNPNVDSYKHYGKRGITVCDEWKHNFSKFAEWALNNGYDENLSIDRINVNMGYSPENCRWVDEVFQANNKRTNTFYEYKGELHTVAEWSRIINIPESALRARLVRYKWSTERAFSTPLNSDKWHQHKGVDNGTIKS